MFTHSWDKAAQRRLCYICSMYILVWILCRIWHRHCALIYLVPSRSVPEYSIIKIFIRWVGIRFSILRFECPFFLLLLNTWQPPQNGSQPVRLAEHLHQQQGADLIAQGADRTILRARWWRGPPEGKHNFYRRGNAIVISTEGTPWRFERMKERRRGTTESVFKWLI